MRKYKPSERDRNIRDWVLAFYFSMGTVLWILACMYIGTHRR